MLKEHMTESNYSLASGDKKINAVLCTCTPNNVHCTHYTIQCTQYNFNSTLYTIKESNFGILLYLLSTRVGVRYEKGKRVLGGFIPMKTSIISNRLCWSGKFWSVTSSIIFSYFFIITITAGHHLYCVQN